MKVLATPDGSCLAVVEPSSATSPAPTLRFYHFASISSPGYDGIALPLSDLDPNFLVISSLSVRNAVHALSLSVYDGLCASRRLRITNKTSDFAFREKGHGVAENESRITTKHNCLIDCHAEVWTRYPVIAAIPRQASFTTSLAPSITYISDRDHEKYAPHFRRLIKDFGSSTRKPTAGHLGKIFVQAMARSSIPRDTHGNVSCFPTGAWLVGLLCLLPIHLAITSSNRFIPLKDGVLSPEFERSLLGAELSTIVNRYINLLWAQHRIKLTPLSHPLACQLGGTRAFFDRTWRRRCANPYRSCLGLILPRIYLACQGCLIYG